MIRKISPFIFFLSVVVVVVACYWPGLYGGFIFDDFPNLSDLGAQGGVVDWATFKFFILSGWSGPTGRPLSLLSFLLDDNTWPSVAFGFKVTNLKLHLLCGLLLCWTCLLLLRARGFSEHKAIWGALICSALWLLHPYMLSTVLYVVQRMAILSTLFVLAGTVGYLQGRKFLEVPQKQRFAYLVMSASLVLGTVLALLCKENGALLPLLVLVVELVALRNVGVKPGRKWTFCFLVLPAIMVVGYLASYINLSPSPWPNRNFNQFERLLTESRILWEYLYHLYVPRIEGDGLFQDGFDVSRGLLSPWTTLPAVVGIVALIIFGWLVRHHWPLLALAILYFFAAHLIESTLLGLELYFEHRNYLASIFLFLPLALGLVRLFETGRKLLAVSAGGFAILLLSGFTWQRAELWSDSERLELYWAVGSLSSARAQTVIADRMLSTGQSEDAIRFLESAAERLPNSSLLAMRVLLLKVQEGSATEDDFSQAESILAGQPFDAQAITGLRALSESTIVHPPAAKYAGRVLTLIQSLEVNSPFARYPAFRRLAFYLKGQLYAELGEFEQGYANYIKAMVLYENPDSALAMVGEMASRGGDAQALRMLEYARGILGRYPDSRLKRSRGVYDAEFGRLEFQLKAEIAAAKNSE